MHGVSEPLIGRELADLVGDSIELITIVVNCHLTLGMMCRLVSYSYCYNHTFFLVIVNVTTHALADLFHIGTRVV